MFPESFSFTSRPFTLAARHFAHNTRRRGGVPERVCREQLSTACHSDSDSVPSKARQIKASVTSYSMCLTRTCLWGERLQCSSQRGDDFMPSTSAGENSCSTLSKTAAASLRPLIISFHQDMVVPFVGAAFLAMRRKGKVERDAFFAEEKRSHREDYASPADDIIKSAWTERGGKMGFRRGMGRLGLCFNACVMATNGLNLPAGELLPEKRLDPQDGARAVIKLDHLGEPEQSVIRGLGSPVAWHTNEATPPEMPVWSSGVLTKLGTPEEGEGERERERERGKVVRGKGGGEMKKDTVAQRRVWVSGGHLLSACEENTVQPSRSRNVTAALGRRGTAR
ncbi:hypothetical protein EYF80_001158 [Liparis tanakae]|uniref:Uncharacterized protein n=1 Tax=Liparis tanakae TaxID=230148 RepID=A0A4Z2JDQ6_9TELE|nr:hypothetical protein EYF80_001158 [Liparis tanakae]